MNLLLGLIVVLLIIGILYLSTDRSVVTPNPPRQPNVQLSFNQSLDQDNTHSRIFSPNQLGLTPADIAPTLDDKYIGQVLNSANLDGRAGCYCPTFCNSVKVDNRMNAIVYPQLGCKPNKSSDCETSFSVPPMIENYSNNSNRENYDNYKDYWIYNHYARKLGKPSTSYDQSMWADYISKGDYTDFHNESIPYGLFSRAYYWYPGFAESGYSFSLRPGINSTVSDSRNRWVRNNDEKFYISNQPYTLPA